MSKQPKKRGRKKPQGNGWVMVINDAMATMRREINARLSALESSTANLERCMERQAMALVKLESPKPTSEKPAPATGGLREFISQHFHINPHESIIGQHLLVVAQVCRERAKRTDYAPDQLCLTELAADAEREAGGKR